MMTTTFLCFVEISPLYAAIENSFPIRSRFQHRWNQLISIRVQSPEPRRAVPTFSHDSFDPLCGILDPTPRDNTHNTHNASYPALFIINSRIFDLIYCLIIAFVVVTVLSLGKKRGSRSFSIAESSASFIFFSTLFLCFRVFERQFIIIQSLPMKTERERERRGTLLRTATIKNMNQLLISSCEVLVRLIYVKTMKQGKYKRFIFFSFFVFMKRICLV